MFFFLVCLFVGVFGCVRSRFVCGGVWVFFLLILSSECTAWRIMFRFVYVFPLILRPIVQIAIPWKAVQISGVVTTLLWKLVTFLFIAANWNITWGLKFHHSSQKNNYELYSHIKISIAWKTNSTPMSHTYVIFIFGCHLVH